MFTEQYIRFESTNAQVFHRGKNYFQAGCVLEFDYNPLANRFDAVVEGTYDYRVSVDLDKNHMVSHYSCNCEAFYKYEGACKHVVATLFEILSKKKVWRDQAPSSEINGATKAFFDFVEKEQSSEWIKEPIHLVPTLCVSETHGLKRVWLELSMGSGRMYLVKNIKALVMAHIKGEVFVLGKQLNYDPHKNELDPVGHAIMSLLVEQYYNEFEIQNLPMNAMGSKLSISSFSNPKQFKLNNTQVHQLLSIVHEKHIELYVNEILHSQVFVTNGAPEVTLDILSDPLKKTTHVNLREGYKTYTLLDWQGRYVHYRDVVYKVDEAFGNYFRKLLPCFEKSKANGFEVPDHLLDRFVNAVYPTLKVCASEVNSDSLESRFLRLPLFTEIYFDRFESGITAKVIFKYGEWAINPLTNQNSIQYDHDKQILRDRIYEKKVLGLLKRYGFSDGTSHYVLHEDEWMYAFLEEGIETLAKEASLFYSEDLKNFKLREKINFKSQTRMNSDLNLLEISFEYDLEDAKELMAVLEAYRTKKKYLKLKDGSVLKMTSEELEMMSELVAYNDKLFSNSQLALSNYENFYVQRLLERYPNIENSVCEVYKKRIEGIKRPSFNESFLSKSHQRILRDYQKTGVLWLKTLTHYGFGGILADDMGLGKTLQVLSYLLNEKENGKLLHPALVVAPTSLIYNWQDEVEKFASDLSVLVVAGSKKERELCFESMTYYDVVITTYGMLKRDVEHYKAQVFSYCFIDEAQHIKNPATLNARAVKSVRAGGFFALTGTPIENTLTELWSIFDFIMPGYLGTLKQFQKQYMGTSEDGKATLQSLGALKHQIDPFLLRRLKKEVLTELPDKIESKTTCEMTKDQRNLYKAQLLKAKEEVQSELRDNGLQKSRVKILSILMRLRQICCHPALFLEGYQGGSGKLDQLIELVDDALSSGHRLLIFSQFTSMLRLIQNAFEERNISSFYLDGGTPASVRTEMCKIFNEGEKDVFLISLKAGGTGLNLTGADMVIHVDPWWNPAVEDQATDRAYRMGQKKSVQVFKMITKDTIEEKIFALQEKKKDLIDSVIVSGDEVISKMTESDILSLFDF